MISTSFHYREKLQLGTAAVRGIFHKDFEGSGQLNTTYFANHCKEIVNYKFTALRTNRWDFQCHFLFNVFDNYLTPFLSLMVTKQQRTTQHNNNN